MPAKTIYNKAVTEEESEKLKMPLPLSCPSDTGQFLPREAEQREKAGFGGGYGSWQAALEAFGLLSQRGAHAQIFSQES